MNDFTGLGLRAPLLRALEEEGYATPTPIQAKAIPILLAGKDLIGIAQTGTGKTAAFALPLLERLAADPQPLQPRTTRVLILAPTRELAIQIGESFAVYGRHLKLRHETAFGGVPIGRQINRIKGGVDVLIATPGRLLDLMRQRCVDLRRVSQFVLDEADRMLDMGFINDVRKIAGELPKIHQTVLFSATMPTEVRKLADSLLHQPERVEVTPPATTVQRIDQSVVFVEKSRKRLALAHILKDEAVSRVLVFTRTKHGANKVVLQLEQDGVLADAIHGNKSQNARQRALDGFRSGKLRVLVATDIASRGIDVDGVTHVVNYELPHEPESYVHRIGRTARAGAAGIAISLVDGEERGLLRDIERATRQAIPVQTISLPAASLQPRPAHSQHRQPEHRQQPQRQPQGANENQPRGERPAGHQQRSERPDGQQQRRRWRGSRHRRRASA